MRRFVCILAALAALFSCKKPLMDTLPRWYTRGPRSYMAKPPETEDGPGLDKPAESGVYTSAIRFPDWAKWKEGDFRGAEVVLFRDSVEVVSVPAGPRPDPERIRILDGRLWTDIANGGTTEVYCNGHYMLSIPSEEMLKGILAENGSIHTLGQLRGGRGMSYRINGAEVFSTGAGTVTSTFMRDTSGICYVYGIPIRKGDSAIMEYHIMKGADEIKTVSPTETGAIYDIRVRDGTVYRSERRSAGHTSLCLVAGDVFHSLGVMSNETIHLCKLVEIDGEMMVKGYSTIRGALWHWIRSKSGIRYQVTLPDVKDFYVDGNVMAIIVNNPDGFVTSIHVGGEVLEMDDCRLRLSSSDCAELRGGVFAAALSDTSGREHRLLLDGQLVPLRFNGYFTSLKIVE